MLVVFARPDWGVVCWVLPPVFDMGDVVFPKPAGGLAPGVVGGGYGERLAVVLDPCVAGVADDLTGLAAWVGTVFVAGRDKFFDELSSVGGVEFAVPKFGCAGLLVLGAACCWREGYRCWDLPSGVAVPALAVFAELAGGLVVELVVFVKLGGAVVCGGLATVFGGSLVFVFVVMRCCSCAFSNACCCSHCDRCR